MGASSYSDIKDSLRNLYLEDPRPWLVGFSGGKDSTMLASLIVEMVERNPIEFLTTETVWAYLLQKPNPWGGDNRPLYKPYAGASNGEYPIQIDTSTPSCGNPFFGCWTCTVVVRNKASEGLLASGYERLDQLVESHQ